MAVPIIMPKQGQSVEICTITNWYKKKGDHVNVGDLLFSYETDKASFEEEAQISGTLLEIFFNEGDDVPVLVNICIIGNPGDDIEIFRPENVVIPQEQVKQETKLQETKPEKIENEIHIPLNTKTPLNTKIKISPRAKKLARKIGVDYRLANASGPGGRIREEDIIALQLNGPMGTFASKGMLNGNMARGT